MNPRASKKTPTVQPFDPHDEWQGLPEYHQRDLTGAYQVTVRFRTDKDAERFFKLIDRPKRRAMWWPTPDRRKKPCSSNVVWVAAKAKAA